MLRLAVVFLMSVTGALAQSGGPAFDVASLKRNMSPSEMGGGGPRPGGRYRLTNLTARSMISIAWGIPVNRVLGGPGWTSVDRYDLDATMNEQSTPEEATAMLRTLLRDRFGLVARIEKRDLPVYFLTQAPAGGIGPNLERATFDCSKLASRGEEAAAAIAARPGRMLCGLAVNDGTFDGGAVTMGTISQVLTPQTGRPVIDRTGLTGMYNVLLKWRPSLSPDAPPGDAVSIFTAVQEQLGLRLESGTAPLDVVVVERIKRPTEN